VGIFGGRALGYFAGRHFDRSVNRIRIVPEAADAQHRRDRVRPAARIFKSFRPNPNTKEESTTWLNWRMPHPAMQQGMTAREECIEDSSAFPKDLPRGLVQTRKPREV